MTERACLCRGHGRQVAACRFVNPYFERCLLHWFCMRDGIRKVRNPWRAYALFFGDVLMGAKRRLLFDCVIGSVFACRLECVVGRDGFDRSGKHLMESTARSMPRSGQCRKLGFCCSTLRILDTEASRNCGNSLNEIKSSLSLVHSQSPCLEILLTSIHEIPLSRMVNSIRMLWDERFPSYRR